jgi:hypothetical protein
MCPAVARLSALYVLVTFQIYSDASATPLLLLLLLLPGQALQD